MRTREPDTPWLTAEEREQWCCEPGDPVPCQERTEDWHGFTEEEILERLGITLNNGRDEQGRIVEIRWRNIPAGGKCGKKVTRMRLPERACCADVAPPAWDTDTSAEVVTPGSSCAVAVTGGRGPYTWHVSGRGFWLNPGHDMTTGETDTAATYLYTDATACGAATVTVTDACGNQTAGYVRSTNGQWVQQSHCEASCFPWVGTYEYVTTIAGATKKIMAVAPECSPATITADAQQCSGPINAADYGITCMIYFTGCPSDPPDCETCARYVDTYTWTC